MEDQIAKKRAARQAARAGRMQDMILDHLEAKLNDKEISATELKVAVDLLKANGWDWNETNVQKTLGDKLTKRVSFDDDLEDDRATYEA